MDETMRPISQLFRSTISHSFPESQLYDPDALERKRVERYNETEGDLNESDGYSCQKCRNKGYQAYFKDGDGMRLRECRCMATRKSIRILRQSGLEHLVSHNRFDTYLCEEDWQENIFRKAKAYAADPTGWFVASGKSGTGKTHICTAICRELMLRGIPTRYMMWRDTIGRIKFGDFAERQEVIRELQNIRCLYIDDFLKVGRGDQPTTADVSLAFEILNHRYNNPELITVISTELTPSEIINIDEAVGSRIYERSKDGTFVLISGNAQNWRLNHA